MGKLRPREGDREFNPQQSRILCGLLLSRGLKELWPSLGPFNHLQFTLRKQMGMWQPDAPWLQMGGSGRRPGWRASYSPASTGQQLDAGAFFLPFCHGEINGSNYFPLREWSLSHPSPLDFNIVQSPLFPRQSLSPLRGTSLSRPL